MLWLSRQVHESEPCMDRRRGMKQGTAQGRDIQVGQGRVSGVEDEEGSCEKADKDERPVPV